MTTSETDAAAHDLETVSVDRFVATMKFVANHDLWDEARDFLAADGKTSLLVDREAIRVFKRLVTEELLGGSRLSGRSHDQASMVAECGCGVSNPGPPGGQPHFPVGGGGDAGTDAGQPQQ